jgi:glutathione S-transferase
MIVLQETNTSYEFVKVGILKGGHKSAEHLKQSFGQVPYLVRATFSPSLVRC